MKQIFILLAMSISSFSALSLNISEIENNAQFAAQSSKHSEAVKILESRQRELEFATEEYQKAANQAAMHPEDPALQDKKSLARSKAEAAEAARNEAEQKENSESPAVLSALKQRRASPKVYFFLESKSSEEDSAVMDVAGNLLCDRFQTSFTIVSKVATQSKLVWECGKEEPMVHDNEKGVATISAPEGKYPSVELVYINLQHYEDEIEFHNQFIDAFCQSDKSATYSVYFPQERVRTLGNSCVDGVDPKPATAY